MTESQIERTRDASENELEQTYVLSKTAVKFLGNFVKDIDDRQVEVNSLTAQHLAVGVMKTHDAQITSGPESRFNKAAIIRNLFLPEATVRKIAGQVIGDESEFNNAYTIIRTMGSKMRRLLPDGVTLEELISMSGGDVEFESQTESTTARALAIAASFGIGLDTSTHVSEPYDIPSGPVKQHKYSDYDPDEPNAWQADSLCAQTDPEAFFPEKGGSTREAKKICGSCEVKNICLQVALQNGERFGIWGGMSEHQRRKLIARVA